MVGHSEGHKPANWQLQSSFTHTNTAGWLNDCLQLCQRKLHLCRVPRAIRLMRYLQLQKYLNLPQKDKVIAEYVWIDGSNGIRSKSKVSSFEFHPSNKALSAPRHLRASWGGIGTFSNLDSGFCTCSHHSWCHRNPRMQELDIVSTAAALCDLTVQRSFPSVWRSLSATSAHQAPR